MAGQKREARLRARCPGHPRLEGRHCEDRKRRSNPDTSTIDWIASLTLAMTSPSNITLPSRAAFRVRVLLRTFAPLKSEGAGNAGRQCTRKPRVQNKNAHELVTTGSPAHTGIPCTMVLTAYSALPGEPGFVATIPAQCEALSRVDASVGASGPHGFAVRSSPRTPCEGTSVHRSLPRVRGDREPPLLVGQDGASA
jgi:hypothetical protein